jgi:hypothetical protein
MLSVISIADTIEKFSAKVKAGIRRTALSRDELLSDRICESVNKVSRTDCHAWISHAMWRAVCLKVYIGINHSLTIVQQLIVKHFVIMLLRATRENDGYESAVRGCE